jgi:hypothetical protein
VKEVDGIGYGMASPPLGVDIHTLDIQIDIDTWIYRYIISNSVRVLYAIVCVCALCLCIAACPFSEEELDSAVSKLLDAALKYSQRNLGTTGFKPFEVRRLQTLDIYDHKRRTIRTFYIYGVRRPSIVKCVRCTHSRQYLWANVCDIDCGVL